jgi:translation initiation factor 3 subunit D
VFTTDIALAVLMAAPRSVASWDIVVQRVGPSLFLDVRDGSSLYDNIVSETAQDAPEDESKDQNNMNSMTALNSEVRGVVRMRI